MLGSQPGHNSDSINGGLVNILGTLRDSPLQALSSVNLTIQKKMSARFISMSQMGKRRFPEVKTLAQGHTASAPAKAGLLVQGCLSEPSSPHPTPRRPGTGLGSHGGVDEARRGGATAEAPRRCLPER